MDFDIYPLADLAARKIQNGYSARHAINSVLKELMLCAEEKELLRRKIAQELNRRSQMRRKKNKKTAEKTVSRAKDAHEKNMKEKLMREMHRMAHERRDHLLPDP